MDQYLQPSFIIMSWSHLGPQSISVEGRLDYKEVSMWKARVGQHLTLGK